MPEIAPAPADPPLLTPEFLRRLETLELVSKKIRAGRMKGDRLSRRKGRGSEFADFRPYSPGDDLRFLFRAAPGAELIAEGGGQRLGHLVLAGLAS